jgi:hypothetical protein
MPKKNINYQNTIIYVIKCRNNEILEEYIGSTTVFKVRKYTHKSDCNNILSKHYNYKIYEFIRENGGWDNWIMLEIEKYPCKDGNEARKREEEIRIERKSNLNSIKAFGGESKEEYHKNYREENKERIKKWFEENKNKLAEKSKEYREKNKDKLIEKQKQYYIKNKDKLIEKQKQYYIENKDKILEYNKNYYKNKILVI